MDRWPHLSLTKRRPLLNAASTSVCKHHITDAPARDRLVDYLDRERARILSMPLSDLRGYALIDVSALLKDAVDRCFLSAKDACSIRRAWIERYCDELSAQIPPRDRDALVMLRSGWRKADRLQRFEALKRATYDRARAAMRAARRAAASIK